MSENSDVSTAKVCEDTECVVKLSDPSVVVKPCDWTHES